MQNEKRLVPQLRFPEFEGKWKKKTIKDVLTIGSGKDYKHLKSGDIPVYGSGGLMTEVNDFLYDGESIGIGRKGTIDKPVFLNGKFWTVDTLFYTHSFIESYPKFIFSQFQRINWKLYNEASGVPSLSKKTIESVLINIPTLPEQKKIAEFVNSMDSRIKDLGKKKNLLELYKKGIMQKIFKQELRFKNDEGEEFPEWREKKLSYYLSVSKKKNNDLTFSKADVLSVSGEYGIVNQIAFQGRSFAGASVQNYGVVMKGDIVYTKSPLKSNPFGIIKVNKGEDGIVSTLYAVYKVKNEKADGIFLDYYFQLDDNTNRYLRPLVRKGAKNDMKINNQYVLHDPVLFPSKMEQIKIANFLSAIDKKIALTNQQLERSKSYKKGLLQQMFV